MQSHLPALERRDDGGDPAARRGRFLEACRQGQKALVVQGVVTVLLAFGAVATVSTAVLDGLASAHGWPTLFNLPVAELQGLLANIEAGAGSATLLLLGARLLTGRYVQMISVDATFLAMELAMDGARVQETGRQPVSE